MDKGKISFECVFVKTNRICTDADLYNQGYEKAFKDIK